MSPGVENLFLILKASGAIDAHTSLRQSYASGQLKYVELKDAVADAVVTMTDPFREKRSQIAADKRAFKDKIKASSAVIREQARQTLKEVKEMVGLMNS